MPQWKQRKISEDRKRQEAELAALEDELFAASPVGGIGVEVTPLLQRQADRQMDEAKAKAYTEAIEVTRVVPPAQVVARSVERSVPMQLGVQEPVSDGVALQHRNVVAYDTATNVFYEPRRIAISDDRQLWCYRIHGTRGTGYYPVRESVMYQSGFLGAFTYCIENEIPRLVVTSAQEIQIVEEVRTMGVNLFNGQRSTPTLFWENAGEMVVYKLDKGIKETFGVRIYTGLAKSLLVDPDGFDRFLGELCSLFADLEAIPVQRKSA